MSVEQRKRTITQRRDAGIEPALSGDRHTDWELWQLSVILAEVAGDTLGNKAHSDESPPTLEMVIDEDLS